MATPTITTALITSNTSQVAAFAGGCFWGIEHLLRKHFQTTQIIDIKVGYANGKEDVHSPSYKAVCTGATNFAEAVLVSYEPSRVSYKELTEFFFRIHDPTTLNSQGHNVGTQYRSGIYYTTPEQQDVAQRVKDVFQREWYKTTPIVTEIQPLKNFYDAEEYHQMYLDVNNLNLNCAAHYLRDRP
ncbi:unnamed protein product [Pichia kudriavzevii]